MPVTGNTAEDIGGIPQASAIVPGNPTPVLLEGSTNVETDNNSNTTTALNVNIKEIGATLLALGQALKVGSIPVVLPSDQVVPVSFGGSLPAGTNVIGHVIIDSAGNVAVTSLPSLPAGTNVIGHVIVDGGSVSVNTITNYAAESGGNLAAIKADADSLVTNTTGLATQATLAAAKTDLDTIVTNTNKIPASPATEGGHLAAIDTSTAASKTDLDTIVTNTNKIPSSPATEGGHLATIDSVQGAAGDTNSTNTVMGRLTKIRDLLLGFVFDSTDKLRASLYVKTSAAGDTVLTLGQTTKSASLPVTFASDQAEPVNVGTPTGSAVSVGTGSTAVVTPGVTAKFLLLINDSPNTIYLNISGGAAALNAGVRLNANGGAILFDRYIPSAAITAISSVAASNLLVEVG